MPWKVRTVEMNRIEFVERALKNEKSKRSLCLEYGISRPTGDKWISRYLNGESCFDRSKTPFHTPNKIDCRVEEILVAARKKEPAIGAKKIHRMLLNKGVENLPCVSTVNAVFKRNNLITKEASLAATPIKRFEKSAPNIMWQADFKGHYAMGDSKRCHPLSIIDDHSRFCLCADAKLNEQRIGTQESFLQTFKSYGLPQSILCDNGNPWGTSQSSGYTLFEIWLMDLGILTLHIRPRHPQTQGKVERFNGSFKSERLKFYVPKDIIEADKQRREYQTFYNNERPHHAINLDVPSYRYKSSDIIYNKIIPEWRYKNTYELRKIKESGYLTFENQGYFLSEAFAGKTIALGESNEPGVINLYYRKFRIGKINLNERVITSRISYLMENDPRLSAPPAGF